MRDRIPKSLRTKSLIFVGLLCGTLLYAIPETTTGVARPDLPRFFRYHADSIERAQAGPIGVLFLGDSITAGWARHPEIWQEAWGDYQPANFGHGGDRTQHIIWRIQHGDWSDSSPRVVVLMIGTNNLNRNTAADIVAGNRRIIELLQQKSPGTRILLLGIFPRGPRINSRGMTEPHEDYARKITQINAELAQWDDGESIRFLDLGPDFTQTDGTIADTIMPDQLHLSAAGYEIWVEGMTPLLKEMMAD